MLHKKYFYMSNKVGQAIIENFDAKFEVIKKGVFLYGKIYVDTIEEMTIQKTSL